MKNYILIPSDMRNQDEVLDLLMSEGPSGYGVFIMACEFLRECEGYKTKNDPKRLSYALRVSDTTLVDRVMHNYGLFQVDDQDMISCPVFSSSMEGYERKREASKKAAEARWQKREGNASADANAMRTHSSGKISAEQPQSVRTSNSNNSNVVKEVSTSKSTVAIPTPMGGVVDFGGVWEVRVEVLSSIAKDKGLPASTEFLAKLEALKDSTHNGAAVANVAKFFRLTEGQTKALYNITGCAEIGSQNLIDVLACMQEAKRTNFTAKFPFNYILSKIRSYAK